MINSLYRSRTESYNAPNLELIFPNLANLPSIVSNNPANKIIPSAIPNYTLSPEGNYDTRAKEVADAIQWTHYNIAKNNGDPTQIFLMGNSAGGHLKKNRI